MKALYTPGRTCYVSLGESHWEELSDGQGAQPAKYMTDNLVTRAASRKGEQGFVVHCQECGKVASKARGGEVLTRKTVVCGKCYDEGKHGPVSTVSHYGREVTA